LNFRQPENWSIASLKFICFIYTKPTRMRLVVGVSCRFRPQTYVCFRAFNAKLGVQSLHTGVPALFLCNGDIIPIRGICEVFFKTQGRIHGLSAANPLRDRWGQFIKFFLFCRRRFRPLLGVTDVGA